MSEETKETTGALDEVNLRLANAWVDFRKRISDFVNNVEECSVQLHFESSLDSRTHYQFEPDEAIFISDVEVSNSNEVIFLVPHGAKTKSFNFKESELINAKKDGNTVPLMEHLTAMYKEAFKEVPEATSITLLERKYLATNGELRAMLNGAEEVIKQHELSIERGQTYSKLDQFGMF